MQKGRAKKPSRMRKINWHLWLKIGEWVVIAILVFVALVTAVSALKIPGSIRLFTVQSGSMAPTIPAGSVVVVKPALVYQKGEVITFKNPEEYLKEKSIRTTTHRIYEVREGEGVMEYVTKGDFNPSPDSEPVIAGLVLGKVIFSVPLLGYPVAFTRTVPGLIILIIIPATLLVYSEILNIKKEAVRIRKEGIKKKVKR